MKLVPVVRNEPTATRKADTAYWAERRDAGRSAQSDEIERQLANP